MLGSVVIAPSAAAGTRVGTTNPKIAGQHASFDAQLIDHINRARIANGLPALLEASGLTIVSARWSKKMSDGPTGGALKHNPTAWTDVTRYGASNRRAWGENVAKLPARTSAKALFDAYMASPGHRANILSQVQLHRHVHHRRRLLALQHHGIHRPGPRTHHYRRLTPK